MAEKCGDISGQDQAVSTTLSVLESLRDAIQYPPPHCSGVVPVCAEDLILFHGRGENACRLDFTTATEESLERLSQACEPATFGLNHEDVLDETYRKAGKIDAEHFMSTFDLDLSGILPLVSGKLLEVRGEDTLRAERYKINVYGKDAFFKAHKDTPRSQNMFGSLVIVFPTKHEGGALILRDYDEEWTFDSAKIISEHDGLCVGYAAFYSDVEHEVAVVQSGYRVTLTYNLYRVLPWTIPSIAYTLASADVPVKTVLEAYS
ncbi:hypothetical protein EUX98_g7738 [Antrodiella citrinella]|uniref:Prolyl 4-hydroxylase alpha subunit Fe(2+) 2OG dioxygenase domain-containing protein n=1 Tax=Antrodiella citrinella TaxID=2447956 RepID=A0A4V6S1R8_9APHY|nr:hypothetical protein EUX98_g7738 [Antrodiella citrinella]